MIPLIGVSVSERLRDRGYDICICFDDLSKHSKAYRQCSLLLNKIPSRDAYPADIFNIQSVYNPHIKSIQLVLTQYTSCGIVVGVHFSLLHQQTKIPSP